MSNPEERYENDPQYRRLCDMLEAFIHEAQFTPSEVRECAVMACIHYEMKFGFRAYQTVPSVVSEAFNVLETFRKSEDRR